MKNILNKILDQPAFRDLVKMEKIFNEVKTCFKGNTIFSVEEIEYEEKPRKIWDLLSIPLKYLTHLEKLTFDCKKQIKIDSSPSEYVSITVIRCIPFYSELKIIQLECILTNNDSRYNKWKFLQNINE